MKLLRRIAVVVVLVAVGLYASAGSRLEPEGRGGLAHIVEHLVFKGAGSRDARSIAEAIEDVGGSLNAWTSRDQTVFHARVLPGDVALAIELIADLVRRPWTSHLLNNKDGALYFK